MIETSDTKGGCPVLAMGPREAVLALAIGAFLCALRLDSSPLLVVDFRSVLAEIAPTFASYAHAVEAALRNLAQLALFARLFIATGRLIMPKSREIVSIDRIDRSILYIRKQKLLLDAELAVFYGVETSALVRAVKRNIDRFPSDFMFRLTKAEFNDLRCQSGTSNLKPQAGRSTRGGLRYLSYAFIEQGVAMLSSVLRSQRAVRVNIEIMRAFVRLRQVLAVNAELAKRLDELEARVGKHNEQFVAVINAIRELMKPPPPRRRKPIGFHTERGG